MFGAVRDYLLPVRHLSLGKQSQELRRNNVLLRSSNNLSISLTVARKFFWLSLLVQCDVCLPTRCDGRLSLWSFPSSPLTARVTRWTFLTVTLSATAPPDLPLHFVFPAVLCVRAAALESSLGFPFPPLRSVTVHIIYALF